MFAAPACLYPVQVLAVAAEAETCFFSLFPKGKEEEQKEPCISCRLWLAYVITLPFSPCFRECCRFFGDNGLTLKVFFTKAAPFGVLWTLTNYLYLHAIKKINTTDVSVLFCCNKAFVFLLSWIVLRDRFMGVRVSDSLSLSPLFPLTLVSFLYPLPPASWVKQHPCRQLSGHTSPCGAGMHPSFPAAFPGACELLEPLAPPAQCLSFRKEVTHWEYVQCIFLQERGNLLQSVSGYVDVCQSLSVPPKWLFPGCHHTRLFLIARSRKPWLHTMHFWSHPGYLKGPSPFYVWQQACRVGQSSFASVSGSSSCGQERRAGLPSPTCGQMCVCMCHWWKVGVCRRLRLASSCGLLFCWHPKCLLTPLVLNPTRMPLQQQQSPVQRVQQKIPQLPADPAAILAAHHVLWQQSGWVTHHPGAKEKASPLQGEGTSGSLLPCFTK